MDVNIFANIIKGIFIYFLKSEIDRKQTFTLSEIKEVFETRYNWTWNNELEKGFNLLKQRFANNQAGLFQYPETEAYEWCNTSLFEDSEEYHKTVLFTYISLQNNLVYLSYVKSLNINNHQLYDDFRVVAQQIFNEKEALRMNEVDEFPF